MVTVEKLDQIFKGKHIIIFGEGYGGKIQAGEEDKKRGGKYSETKKYRVFDILVESKYWLGRSSIQTIYSAPGLDCVPLAGNFTLHEAVQTVRGGFRSLLGKGIKAEGLIGKTSIPLFDSRHRRLICKIKSSDF